MPTSIASQSQVENNAMLEPLIKAVDLRMSYEKPSGKRVDVLGGISLEIEPKKVLSIVGPSGCGKSTLLRILAGVESCQSGSVSYGGMEKQRVPPIPMVLQSAALLPWRTVRQNIALGLELLGSSQPEAVAEEYATIVGLAGFTDSLPKNLSGGMQARVSIARALVIASDLVLFDEAFTELDEVTRQTLTDIFCQHVEERGLAAIIVSHDIAEAAYLADEVVVLTKRPATVARVFKTDFPRPRRSQSRLHPDFTKTVQAIREFAVRTWRET
jgi:NitT/TauT family transport system ATP-binding protein